MSSSKQFSFELETEAEVVLTLLIKLINWCEAQPQQIGCRGDHAILYMYMTVSAGFLATLNLCTMTGRDALATDSDTDSTSSARVFPLLIPALKLKGLVTSRPPSAKMQGVGIFVSDFNRTFIDSLAWKASRRWW